MKYLTAVHTDAGVGKCTNQDSVLMETADTEYGQVLLGAVCDGMGGLAKGGGRQRYPGKGIFRLVSQRISGDSL